MDRKRRRSILDTITENHLSGEINNIFETVQHNISCHEKCSKLLKNIYNKTEEDIFFDYFINCLEKPLQFGEKNVKVERTLDFAAKFCTSFGEVVTSEDDDESEMHPFLKKVFHYALKYHSSNTPGFRYRICQFVNKILVCLGEQAELDDKLCDNILRGMLDRLQDPKYKVRTQAIIALHRLQNPTDLKDPVTKAYLFHLKSDPSPQVRRAAVNNLARSAKSFPEVMTRIQDVDEKVRRDAYNFLGMYSSKSFKIIQRMTLLKAGLTDRSALVKKCVSNTLIPKWFVHYERSYFDFLKAIRVDVNMQSIKDSIGVSQLLLNVFFTDGSAREIIEVLPLDEHKVLNYEILDHEHVLYWRYLVQFFHKQGINGEDFLEEILPELTVFCNYIKSFVAKSHEKERDQLEENIYQSILQQLFEMINYFDLLDEVGRNNLKTLINDVLLKEVLSTQVIDSIMRIFEILVPQSNQRIMELIQLISDITEPIEEEVIEISADEKRRKEVKICELRFRINVLNDKEETAVTEKNYVDAARIKDEHAELRKKLNELLSQSAPVSEVRRKTEDEKRVLKALEMVEAMFQTDTIRELTPELRSLQKNLISDYCLQSNTPSKIETVALKCLANCAFLDENLAVSIMPKFFYRIVSYQYNLAMHPDVVNAALSAIFDLLSIYDISKFEPSDDTTKSTNQRSAGNKTKRALYDETQFDDSDDDDDDETASQQDDLSHLPLNASTNDIITSILAFLDDELVEFRTVAAKGLIRLLVCGRFKSTEVLTRLIILWFNPVTENDVELRQVLGIMLNHFAVHTPGSQEEFEKAFLPVLHTVLSAPSTSPLSQVDVDTIIHFMLTHTHPGYSAVDTVNVHNHLALILCEEILKSESDSRDKMHFIKSLPNLFVNEDDINLRNDLRNLCIKIIDTTKNKNYIRCVEKFMKQIQPMQLDEEGTNQTTIDDENAMEINTDDQNDMPSKQRNSLLDKSLRIALVRLDDLKDNEDEVSIDDSSPKDTSSQNTSNRRYVVISTSESEEEIESSSSSSESEKEFKLPVVRSSLRRLRIK